MKIPYLRFLRISSEFVPIAFCFQDNFTLHSTYLLKKMSALTNIHFLSWWFILSPMIFWRLSSFDKFVQPIRHNWIWVVSQLHSPQNWDPRTCWHPKNPIEVSPEFESNTRRWQRIGNFFNPLLWKCKMGEMRFSAQTEPRSWISVQILDSSSLFFTWPIRCMGPV